MRKLPVFVGISLAVFAASLVWVACGGSSSLTTPSQSDNADSPSGSAAMVIDVGDAPMDGVLSSLVTINSVTLTYSNNGSSTTTANLLAQPQQIEVSDLGGVRAPLVLTTVPAGSYTAVSVGFSAAQVTYLDPTTGLPVQGTATIGGSNPATFTFAQPVTVSTSADVDLHIDLNLPESFDLTNGVITFTPTIRAAVANIGQESNTDREFQALGTVTAVSTANNTISIQTIPAGYNLVFTVNSSTQWDDNSSLSTLQVGAIVVVQATVQPNAQITFLATEIDPVEAGEKFGNLYNDGGEGVVTAVTDDSNDNLTSFNMVLRSSFLPKYIGRTLTVNVTEVNTQFLITHNMKNAGITAFDATQIYPGQSVTVAGMDVNGPGSALTALEIRLSASTHDGQLASAVSGTAPNLTFTFQPNPAGWFAMLTKAATVTVLTDQSTNYGDNFSAADLVAEPTNQALSVRGFSEQASGAYTVYATLVATPE